MTEDGFRKGWLKNAGLKSDWPIRRGSKCVYEQEKTRFDTVTNETKRRKQVFSSEKFARSYQIRWLCTYRQTSPSSSLNLAHGCPMYIQWRLICDPKKLRDYIDNMLQDRPHADLFLSRLILKMNMPEPVKCDDQISIKSCGRVDFRACWPSGTTPVVFQTLRSCCHIT